MNKLNVCILFGGISPEHEVSLRSAESVLNNIDAEKYNIYPIGITKDGNWILFGGKDYSELPGGKWETNPNNKKTTISPIRGQGLLCFEEDRVVTEKIHVVFPVLHGENGEDGAIQGLLKISGIPYVGPHVAESAVSMDKSLTKLVMDHAGIRQADWVLIFNSELHNHLDDVVERIEEKFQYPVFVKPAGTGSSVGVSKASDRSCLAAALFEAGKFGEKILVEECIIGKEIEVAVMGNTSPVASVCGEIDSGAEFYDYDAKYLTDTSIAYIPARIPEDIAEQVRELAVKAFRTVGCQGLSRVDFFVTENNEIILNEINTIPGFTSISMYPKLFDASGIPYGQLIDKLLMLAMEDNKG